MVTAFYEKTLIQDEPIFVHVWATLCVYWGVEVGRDVI